MSRTTTALVLTAIKGPLELREVHLDSIRPDEALVEIHASGICHTDISCANGILPCAPGAVLGHEGSFPRPIPAPPATQKHPQSNPPPFKQAQE